MAFTTVALLAGCLGRAAAEACSCKATWSNTFCSNQEGCPATACDGSSFNWCEVEPAGCDGSFYSSYHGHYWMICDQSTPVSGPTDQPSQSPHDDDDDDDSPMMTTMILVALVLACLPLCCCCVFRVEEVESDKLDTPAVGFCCCCVAPIYKVEGVRPKTPCCWEASATEEGAAPGVRQFVERRTMVCQTPCIPESVRKVSAILLATANVAIIFTWLLRSTLRGPIIGTFLLSAICFGCTGGGETAAAPRPAPPAAASSPAAAARPAPWWAEHLARIRRGEPLGAETASPVEVAPPPTVRAQPPASSRTDHATPPQPTGARPQSEGECGICFEPYSDRVTTPCNHSFCRQCITQVLATNPPRNEAPCPFCRAVVRLRDLQPSAAAAHGRPLERPRAHHERRPAALDAAANRFINMQRQAMWGTADVVNRVHRRHVDRASEARDRDARRRQREEAARYREAAAARDEAAALDSGRRHATVISVEPIPTATAVPVPPGAVEMVQAHATEPPDQARVVSD
mmetsp:Transcript_10397/g.30734  ORF Transcript_10397/g.30734 Transcript_10397/m.30734 type:complete len:517 (+) Transcript_10397:236-1786(+)